MELNPRTEALRERLSRRELLVVPGAFNALAAKMTEEAGFEAVYATGAGVSNAYLGAPDVGLITASEMTAHVQAMVDATQVPILADIDTGYGGVHNVVRTIQGMEAAGVSAVQIEDQSLPKRCGHFDRKVLVPVEEMLAKLLAATDSRQRGTLIIGRTDAIAVEGFDAAIRRANAYREAGADIIFVEALEDEDQIRRLPKLVEGPLMLNMVEGGITPFLDPRELQDVGYSIITFANFALRTVMKSLRDGLLQLRKAGTSAGLSDLYLSWEERQELVGLGRFDASEDAWHERAVELSDSLDGQGLRVHGETQDTMDGP